MYCYSLRYVFVYVEIKVKKTQVNLRQPFILKIEVFIIFLTTYCDFC